VSAIRDLLDRWVAESRAAHEEFLAAPNACTSAHLDRVWTMDQSIMLLSYALAMDLAATDRNALSVSLRARLWLRDAGLCGICGEPADEAAFHIDHVLPVTLGGTNDEANLQVSHPACNLAKGAALADTTGLAAISWPI
jgi:5-methylcytosine-specific restriction endonuclease McrA